MVNGTLQGWSVLVTRPVSQANELVEAIESRDGNAICFPVIDIVARDKSLVASDAARLPDPDVVIFVSSNAVKYGLGYADKATKAAIGPATAEAIQAAGYSVDIMPSSGFDSESLLREAELSQVTGKSVWIVRGNGGRELLGETLSDRGAHVSYLSVYDRQQPVVSPVLLRELESVCLSGRLKAITVMSVESLDNLMRMLPDSCLNEFRNIPLVTPATRVIKEAHDRYPALRPILASGIQTTDLLEAIESIRTTKR